MANLSPNRNKSIGLGKGDGLKSLWGGNWIFMHCLHQFKTSRLKQLVTGFSPRRPRLDLGLVHVRSVMDKMALDQVSLRLLRFPAVSIISLMFHNNIHLYYMLMLLEGKTYEIWKPSNSNVLSAIGKHWTEKYFTFSKLPASGGQCLAFHHAELGSIQGQPITICGGQSGIRTGFSPNTSVFRCERHSVGAPYSFSYQD